MRSLCASGQPSSSASPRLDWSRARDNPKSITAGSQAFGAPAIPFDEDLELIGVEDGSALEDACARPLDPLAFPWDPLAASALDTLILLYAHG